MPILFLIGIANCNAQNISCKDLVKYRNNELLNVWFSNKQTANKNIEANKYVINQINNAVKIQDKRNLWNDTETLVLSIKLTANTIEDILEILKPYANVPDATGYTKSIKKLLDMYKDIESFNEVLTNESNIEIIIESFKKIPKLGQVIGLIDNIKDNINLFEKNHATRQEIRNNIVNLKSQKQKYYYQIDSIKLKYNNYNSYLNQIDKYLKENCKYELKENPIDIESILWNSNKSNINIEDYNYNISEMLNNPEFLPYFDFNDQFMNELTQLISKIDYNSEASMNNYITQLESLMEKYVKKTNANPYFKEAKIIQPKKRKAATARNVSSYANFKKNRTSNSNSSGIRRAQVNRSNNNFKPKSCGHSASWHKKNGTCASEQ